MPVPTPLIRETQRHNHGGHFNSVLHPTCGAGKGIWGVQKIFDVWVAFVNSMLKFNPRISDVLCWRRL